MLFRHWAEVNLVPCSSSRFSGVFRDRIGSLWFIRSSQHFTFCCSHCSFPCFSRSFAPSSRAWLLLFTSTIAQCQPLNKNDNHVRCSGVCFTHSRPTAPTHNHVCPTQKSDTPSTNHTKFIWFPEHPSHARLGSGVRETKNRNRKKCCSFRDLSQGSKHFFIFTELRGDVWRVCLPKHISSSRGKINGSLSVGNGVYERWQVDSLYSKKCHSELRGTFWALTAGGKNYNSESCVCVEGRIDCLRRRNLPHTPWRETQPRFAFQYFVDFRRMLIFDCLFPISRSLPTPMPEISSTEFETQIQFDAVTSTSIYSRYQRSQEDDFGGDNGGFDVEHDGEEFVQHPPLDRGPYFDTSASKNVTALVGTTTYLNCRVRNLGNKTVSSLRLHAVAPFNDLILSLGDLDPSPWFAPADGRKSHLHLG